VGVSVGPVGVPGGLAGGGGGGWRHCRQLGSGLALSRDNFILFMNRSSVRKNIRKKINFPQSKIFLYDQYHKVAILKKKK
jgi:hypothetical protein